MNSPLLEKWYKKYQKNYLKEDPICFVHQYRDPKDQEVVALLSSLLAFGNAKVILANLSKLLDILGEHPISFLLNKSIPPSQISDFKHRWVTSVDIQTLFKTLKKILSKHGSLKKLFLEDYQKSDPDISKALHHFSHTLQKESGLNFLFPSPIDGSPCKRMNLFLRWMVRPRDGIDLGLWKEISPSQLVIPLDTHIYQFAKKFKISRRKNPSWRMALEVTGYLKTLDPQDPVKFDFAICHFGMENGWDM